MNSPVEQEYIDITTIFILELKLLFCCWDVYFMNKLIPQFSALYVTKNPQNFISTSNCLLFIFFKQTYQ